MTWHLPCLTVTFLFSTSPFPRRVSPVLALPISPCSVNSYIENLASLPVSWLVVLLLVPYQGFPKPLPISKYSVHWNAVYQQPSPENPTEWVERGVQKSIFFIYNEILLSHKNNEIMPCVATWMDREIIVLSEASQTAKDRYHMILFICLYMFICGFWKKKNDTNELTSKAETHRHRKQTYGYQKGKGVGDG